MWRTEKCVYRVKNWIFLLVAVYLFTHARGGDDRGVQLTQEPQDAVVVEGGLVVLACAAHRAALSWRYATTTMPTREHALSPGDKYRKQLSNGSLVIENMSASLAGQYQCVATLDGVGTVVSRIATVFLAEVPEISAGPRSVLGVSGAPALLPCTLRAPPRPPLRVVGAGARGGTGALEVLVSWVRNGVAVRPEGARVSQSPSGALELDPASHADSGVYRCRVSLAHATHQHRLGEEIELRVSTEVGNVESPPRFIATPQPLTVMEGASVILDCAAVGNPKPEIVWLNNGIAIDLSDLDSRFYRVGSGSLGVAGARAQDSGAYTCRATNRLDSADHGTTLTVLSAPRVSVGGAVVAHARGDVELPCSASGRPEPRAAWLKDGEPITLNHHDIALVHNWSLRIQGVLRVDAGMFQCAASSPAGSAVAALRLQVVDPQDELLNETPDSLPKGPPTSTIVSRTFPALVPPTHTNMSSTHTHTRDSNSTQDIFDNLVSSDNFGDQIEPSPEELDFLGETSPAYTSESDNEYSYDMYDDNPTLFHAAQGLDLEDVKGNASVVSPPKELKAVIVKHRFVTLSWEDPDHVADHITGYAVIYKVKGSKRERVSRGAGSRHEMTVGALQPNTTYQFRVVASTRRALSPPSQMIEETTPEEELTYGPPGDLRAVPLGPHSLHVSWSPPARLAHEAPAPDKYTVYYTEMESGREQFQWVSGAEATLGGLRADAAYALRVAAAGGAPGTLTARTPAAPPAAPPANLTAAPTAPTSILVTWEAPPPRSHRGALTGYKVRFRPAPAPGAAPEPGAPRRKADSLTTPADVRRAELRDLDPDTTYQIRVCALNANGSGPFSEWVSASTQQPRRDESAVPPQPPPLSTKAGRDWISVWWAGSGGGAARYWLGWGLGVPDDAAQDLPGHQHSHVIRNLQPNSEYVISLRASNARGPGPAVYATVRTRAADRDEPGDDEEDPDDDREDLDEEDDSPPLIPPVGVKVIMLSGTTAVVYWTDPTLPKGQPATDGRRYVVRWAAAGAGQGAGRPRYFNATDLNCMLDDLKPYTHYEFAVKLIKGGRESSWSMLVANTSLEAAPASPPRDVRAAPAPPPHRALDLSWAPPAKPNGVITGYVVMYASQREGGSEEWSVEGVGGDRLRLRLERLRARTRYSLKVQARTARGLGPFSAPLLYTTAPDAGAGGGLAAATSAWLWASAGGACAVLGLAAALALSLCCRRSHPPLSPDTSTYQKSSASAGIKPPDLWIHHDQMELKHLDKSLQSSTISAGSVEGGASSGTLPPARAAPPALPEYEPARLAPASLDRRHYVPAYVDSRASSRGGSDDTASCRRCEEYAPMSGAGAGAGAGCVGSCERRALLRHAPDQSTPLLAGVAPLGSPQSSLASLSHHPPHCGASACPLGPACGGAGGGDVYACAARERGHYVAYEPLGHYSHRDSMSSEVGGAGAGAGAGSLQRRAAGAAGHALHSFALSSDTASAHSTPSHGKGSVRETSPYKKSASSSPGHLPNRLHLGSVVAQHAEELEPLTPSRSTERLHREMQNLEGLMKDLSAITHQQFHC